MKRPNGMNCIHDNKGNKISEWNLLHDILKYYKRTKYINCHYITAPFLILSFSISLLVTIVELNPLSNKNPKSLNIVLPFCVFMQQCRIGE